MSLRRSARVQASAALPKTGAESSSSASGEQKRRPASRTKKIAQSTSQTAPPAAPATASDAPDGVVNGDTLQSSEASGTPRKKRKTQKGTQVEDASPIKLPPTTPPPAAIGLMTDKTPKPKPYSTGDIDDPSPTHWPTRPRPASPHQTNAPVQIPGAPQVLVDYSNLGANPAAAITTDNLLEKACTHLIQVDPRLKPVIEKHYCRVFCPEGLREEVDPFRSLASGIMAQQVSGAAASSIKAKFISLFPSAPSFPTPAAVAASSLPFLRSAGLSQRKAEYIQGLAQQFVSGELSAEMLLAASDEEVLERLVKVRGLGRWSVEMFACFGLKRMDVFSTGDLGVQ
ncbi:3-methyladenine DNA glycosylase [Cryomyces antarcticus]|nr:3-methyladenine DNA glycosylase [Cryomyces antarcticus]